MLDKRMTGCASISLRQAMAILVLTCVVQIGLCADGNVSEAVSMGDIPPVDIDWKTSSGQVLLTVSNTTSAEQNATLCAGSCVGGSPDDVLPAQISFQGLTDPSGSPILTVHLNGGETKPVKLIVSGYRQPGESTGVVTLNGRKHDFSVQLVDVPFKVGVQTATGDKPEVSFTRGGSGLIVLTNDDPVAYPAHWCLYLPGNGDVAEGDVSLPAGSAIPVTVTPKVSWFRNSFQGLFKDDVRSARLTLRLSDADRSSPALSRTAGHCQVSPSPVASQGTRRILPARTLPLQMSLVYWDDGKLWGYLILLVVLALGAGLSIVLNGWIPNYLARAALFRRLGEVARDIRGISSQADSRLRVILRVCRMGLGEQLVALKALNLDTADQLRQLGSEVDVLDRRVEMALRLDGLGTRFRAACVSNTDLAPSVLDEISASLAQATEILCKLTLQETDYALAAAALDHATANLDRLEGENPVLAKELANRVIELDAQYAPAGELGQIAACATVRGAVASTMFACLSIPRYKDPTQILPADYKFLDVATRKLMVLRDYIRIAETVAQDPADTVGKQMVASCWQALTDQLRRNDCDSLKRARCIVRQLDERVLAQDIEQALQDGLFTLSWDPPLVLPNQPIRLSVRLTSRELENRAAQEELTCEWEFPAPVGLETGWEITHYFRVPSEMSFEARFRKRNGQLVLDKSGAQPLTLKSSDFGLSLGSLPNSRRSDAAKAESLRLVLALGLAIMGLVAGAHEQFMKLDVFFGLLTVLMLGFSADTIKNLFAKRS